MEPLKNILSQRIKNYDFAPAVSSSLVVEKFNDLLSAEFSSEIISRQAKAIYIKNKAIYVVVLSSVMAQEIKFKEKDLLEKINDFYNKVIIQQICYLG